MVGITVLQSWVPSSLVSPLALAGLCWPPAALWFWHSCGVPAGSVPQLPVVGFLPYRGPFPLGQRLPGADGSASRQENETRGPPWVSPVL